MMKVFREQPLYAGTGFNDDSLIRFVVFSGLIISLILLAMQPLETPLSIVLNGGSVIDAQIARKNLIEGTGIRIIDIMINYQTIQMLSLIALIMVIKTKKIKWWEIFIILFIISLYMAISSGITSRLIYYFLSIAFARSITNGIFIRKIEVVYIAPILVAMFVYFKGAEGAIIDILINDIISRIFLTQNFGLYVALTVFPDMHPFIGLGSTSRELHSILGLNFTESYGIVMMQFTQYEAVLAGHAGHLTSLFMAEAWANFGLIGIIIAPLWVGGFVQLVNIAFIRKKREATSIAVYSILATTFGYTSDFISFYYLIGFILNLIGIYSLFKLGKYFSLKI